MDPIMKLLEEEEDESMHSGADVEAFTAALNRDIAAAGASSSQPSQSDSSAWSEENNQNSSYMYSQWQPSSHDENNGDQSQQQQLRNQEQREHQSSDMEVKERGTSIDVQQDANGSQSQAPGGVQVQYKPLQINSQGHQLEQKSGEFSQSAAGMQVQMSGTGHSQMHETQRLHNQSGTESQVSNIQRFSSQPTPVSDQVSSSATRTKQIPFGCLLPIILPELDKDRAMQLQTFYAKLRRIEIPKDGFVRLMRSIVGDQMLRLAVVKMQAKGNKNPEAGSTYFQMQSQNPMQQQQLRPMSGTTAQFSDPYSFGQQHQKSQSSPAMTVASRGASPMMQPQKDSGRHMEQVAESCGTQANQMPDRSVISMQGLTKQQQQHLHFSQGSFPMYGTGSFNPYAGTNVNTSTSMVRTQPNDAQMRQGQLHQGFGSAHTVGTSQAMNAMNFPKIERQGSLSEQQRMHSANMSTVSSTAQSSMPKQPMGPAFPGVAPAEQGKAIPRTSADEVSERQHPAIAPQSTRTANVALSSSMTTHVAPSADADLQVGPQSVSASPISATGGNAKASAKKPASGQKKPLDAHSALPSTQSKKQKVSGAFSDQSIEHLNDVTAVSGVNLREEEEQLFSGAKDDGRVSEASRKAVQEEEDRLILQKTPLHKKLAEIMTKFGLKNLSNDVERCLSLCVEERLRGLISSLIRVSKLRADSEKSRHNTVVTSDVREQILTVNRKAREDWEKKQAEAEKLRKINEPESASGVDGEKEKEEGRGKSVKVNKEEDDKMRTTAANVAARAAVGGDDMLSKWQLMAQAARQKREGGPESVSISQTGKDTSNKPSTSSVVNARDTRGVGKKDEPSLPSASGVVGQSGRSQVTVPPPRVARSISVKDVIAVLEREPQMAKSTILYRLYEKMRSDAAAE